MLSRKLEGAEARAVSHHPGLKIQILLVILGWISRTGLRQVHVPARPGLRG